MANNSLRPEQAMFYQTLANLPVGYYCSYGEMAKACGVHVRQILAWLRKLPDDSQLPWHRLINSQRRISAHPGRHQQAERLAQEGLVVDASGRYPVEFQWPLN